MEQQINKSITNEGIIADKIISPCFTVLSDDSVLISGKFTIIPKEIEVSKRNIIISKENLTIF